MRIQTAADAEKCKETRSKHAPTYPAIGSLVLPVPGAGYLEFGQFRSSCGGARGIGIDCSWSPFGYSGGVMDRKDMIELRDYLTAWLDGTLELIDDEESTDTPTRPH